MATSKFIRTFRTTAGLPVTTATIWLVPQANTYPNGALALTPHATRDGQYYRDNVPDGEYKIYIDPAGGSSPTLYEEEIWIGEARITTISNHFDEADGYKLKTTGIKNDAVTKDHIAANVAGKGMEQDTDGSLKVEFNKKIFQSGASLAYMNLGKVVKEIKLFNADKRYRYSIERFRRDSSGANTYLFVCRLNDAGTGVDTGLGGNGRICSFFDSEDPNWSYPAQVAGRRLTTVYLKEENSSGITGYAVLDLDETTDGFQTDMFWSVSGLSDDCIITNPNTYVPGFIDQAGVDSKITIRVNSIFQPDATFTKIPTINAACLDGYLIGANNNYKYSIERMAKNLSGGSRCYVFVCRLNSAGTAVDTVLGGNGRACYWDSEEYPTWTMPGLINGKRVETLFLKETNSSGIAGYLLIDWEALTVSGSYQLDMFFADTGLGIDFTSPLAPDGAGSNNIIAADVITPFTGDIVNIGKNTSNNTNEVFLDEGDIASYDAASDGFVIPKGRGFIQESSFAGSALSKVVSITGALSTDVYMLACKGSAPEELSYVAASGQVTVYRDAGGADNLAFALIRIKLV